MSLVNVTSVVGLFDCAAGMTTSRPTSAVTSQITLSRSRTAHFLSRTGSRFLDHRIVSTLLLGSKRVKPSQLTLCLEDSTKSRSPERLRLRRRIAAVFASMRFEGPMDANGPPTP